MSSLLVLMKLKHSHGWITIHICTTEKTWTRSMCLILHARRGCSLLMKMEVFEMNLGTLYQMDPLSNLSTSV